MKYNVIKNKKGNITIMCLGFLLIIIIFFVFNIYVAYIQVSTLIEPVKQDIFYIVQNSFFSLNKNELKYDKYNVNQSELYEKINNLVTLNYKNQVKINSINYDYNLNKVNISYTVYFYPIVFKEVLGQKVEVKFFDNIKLKNMEVK